MKGASRDQENGKTKKRQLAKMQDSRMQEHDGKRCEGLLLNALHGFPSWSSSGGWDGGSSSHACPELWGGGTLSNRGMRPSAEGTGIVHDALPAVGVWRRHGCGNSRSWTREVSFVLCSDSLLRSRVCGTSRESLDVQQACPAEDGGDHRRGGEPTPGTEAFLSPSFRSMGGAAGLCVGEGSRGAPTSTSGRFDLGAPSCDGTANWEGVGGVGGGASQEWRHRRQPDRKPRVARWQEEVKHSASSGARCGLKACSPDITSAGRPPSCSRKGTAQVPQEEGKLTKRGARPFFSW